MSAFRLRPFHWTDQKIEIGESALPVPSFGLTAETLDGEIAGYIGVRHFDNRWFAFFFACHPDLRRPVWLHRLARRMTDGGMAMGIEPLFAMCDPIIPRASQWLTALGYVRHGGETINGREVWVRWRA